MSTKQNLPNSSSTNDNYTSEYNQYNYLYMLKPRSQTGNLIFTSTTSGTVYDLSLTAYANQGQEGMLLLLQSVLTNYLIIATDFNAKVEQTDFNTHLADYIRQPAFSITSGTSTAYTVTLSPVLTAYLDGVGITIKPHVDCGASPTLNVNALGAKSLLKPDGSAFDAGDLKTGIPYAFKYNGTNFIQPYDSGAKINAIIGDYVIAAGETLSAGDLVTFINNQAKKAYLEVSNVATTLPPSFNLGLVDATLINTDKVLITYSISTTGYAVVVTVSGVTITVGTSVVVATIASGAKTACEKLDTDKAIATYKVSTTDFRAVVLTISGTTITVNGTSYSISTSNYNDPVLTQLSTNKVLMTVTNNSSYLAGIVLTVSGTVISYGSFYTIKSAVISNYSSHPKDALLDSGRVLISYDLSTTLETVVLSVSGTVITIGTPVVIVTHSTTNVSSYNSSTLMATDKILILFQHLVSTGYYNLKTAVLSISETTITLNTSVVISEGQVGRQTRLQKYSDNMAIAAVNFSSSGNDSIDLYFVINATLTTPIYTSPKSLNVKADRSQRFLLLNNGLMLEIVRIPGTNEGYINLLKLITVAQGLAVQNGVGGDTKKFYDWR